MKQLLVETKKIHSVILSIKVKANGQVQVYLSLSYLIGYGGKVPFTFLKKKFFLSVYFLMAKDFFAF